MRNCTYITWLKYWTSQPGFLEPPLTVWFKETPVSVSAESLKTSQSFVVCEVLRKTHDEVSNILPCVFHLSNDLQSLSYVLAFHILSWNPRTVFQTQYLMLTFFPNCWISSMPLSMNLLVLPSCHVMVDIPSVFVSLCHFDKDVFTFPFLFW